MANLVIAQEPAKQSNWLTEFHKQEQYQGEKLQLQLEIS